MTVEKLKTAVANINAYLSESHDDDDTVTLTINVIKSVKENYEELIEAKAEIERLKNDCFCLANERDAYKDVLDTAVVEALKEFAERVKQKTLAMVFSPDVLSFEDYCECIDNLVKEMVGEGRC